MDQIQSEVRHHQHLCPSYNLSGNQDLVGLPMQMELIRVIVVVKLVLIIVRIVRVVFFHVRKLPLILLTVKKVPNVVYGREKSFRRCLGVFFTGQVPVVAPTRIKLKSQLLPDLNSTQALIINILWELVLHHSINSI